jgi:hypothetical protein
MSILSRMLAIGLSLFLMISILGLVRRRKLKEKYAILWLFAGAGILLIAIFDNVLIWITNLLGITLPVNTVFFVGFFFLTIINLHFTLVISNLSEQNKKIVQKIALIEKYEKLND